MSKKEGMLLSITCFLTGFALGFLISPVKQGVGNNCGNTTNYYNDKKEENIDE